MSLVFKKIIDFYIIYILAFLKLNKYCFFNISFNIIKSNNLKKLVVFKNQI